MDEKMMESPMFSQKFNDFLRSMDFPDIFFHNAYAYHNALESEQYKHLVEEYRILTEDHS